MYHARQRVEREDFVSRRKDSYLSINNLYYFFNPARRRRDGVNPAPQNGQRGGVKEDYYV